jgi:hypothetical protein
MTYTTALFVGGPAHGQLRALPDSRSTYEVLEATDPLAVWRDTHAPDEAVPHRTIAYYREVVASSEPSSQPAHSTTRRLVVMLAQDAHRLDDTTKLRLVLAAMLHNHPGVEEDERFDPISKPPASLAIDAGTM